MIWLTMIWFFIVRIIISIGILFILHNLYDYCKQNFTTKKTKDLVSLHKEKYQEILNELHNQPNSSGYPPSGVTDRVCSEEATRYGSPLPNVETQPDELTFQDKAFLQQSLLTMIQTSV